MAVTDLTAAQQAGRGAGRSSNTVHKVFWSPPVVLTLASLPMHPSGPRSLARTSEVSGKEGREVRNKQLQKLPCAQHCTRFFKCASPSNLYTFQACIRAIMQVRQLKFRELISQKHIGITAMFLQSNARYKAGARKKEVKATHLWSLWNTTTGRVQQRAKVSGHLLCISVMLKSSG